MSIPVTLSPSQAINAKRGFGWDTNPFCWVLDVRRAT